MRAAGKSPVLVRRQSYLSFRYLPDKAGAGSKPVEQSAQARFGLQKTSLIDFPGRVSAVVFTASCNLRCPWCHNGSLLGTEDGGGEEKSSGAALWYNLPELDRFLRKRRSILGAVVISGGEPLLSPSLPELLELLQKYELPWKLDTNGTLPGKLSVLLERYSRFLPDLISVDLKMNAEHYPERLGAPEGGGERVFESLKAIKGNGVLWEARTTFHPDILSIDNLFSLAGYVREQIRQNLIAEPPRWSIQPFRPGRCLDAAWNRKREPSSRLIEKARSVIDAAAFNAVVRGYGEPDRINQLMEPFP
jgi:pyruvate formate lyase activating enzyme